MPPFEFCSVVATTTTTKQGGIVYLRQEICGVSYTDDFFVVSCLREDSSCFAMPTIFAWLLSIINLFSFKTSFSFSHSYSKGSTLFWPRSQRNQMNHANSSRRLKKAFIIIVVMSLCISGRCERGFWFYPHQLPIFLSLLPLKSSWPLTLN